MSAPTLLLLRHGQTAWNAARRVLGRTDLPLDGVGESQATALAGALRRVDAVWSSPLLRARQTADAVRGAQPHLTLRLHESLTEMHQGDLEGMGEAELLAEHKALMHRFRSDPAGVRLPGGETLDEVQARAMAALHEIATAATPGSTVLVATHQLVISSVLCALRGESLAEWRSHTHPNTAWTEVAWGREPVVVAAKQAPHLNPA